MPFRCSDDVEDRYWTRNVVRQFGLSNLNFFEPNVVLQAAELWLMDDSHIYSWGDGDFGTLPRESWSKVHTSIESWTGMAVKQPNFTP